jgi:hypothetical protein
LSRLQRALDVANADIAAVLYILAGKPGTAIGVVKLLLSLAGSRANPDFSPALPEGRGFNPAGDESPLALLNFHALDSSSPRAVQRVRGD